MLGDRVVLSRASTNVQLTITSLCLKVNIDFTSLSWINMNTINSVSHHGIDNYQTNFSLNLNSFISQNLEGLFWVQQIIIYQNFFPAFRP